MDGRHDAEQELKLVDGSGDVASETEDRTFRLNKEAFDKILIGSKTHQKLLFNL